MDTEKRQAQVGGGVFQSDSNINLQTSVINGDMSERSTVLLYCTLYSDMHSI